MKKILLGFGLLLFCNILFAQNGLEGIIVEKYYVSNTNDTLANSISGKLPVGSVTYRIYADMLPGYKFQAAYGVPDHELKIATTTSFFNNEDRGSTAPTNSKTSIRDNTVMLDSWLSVGAACSGNYGILKSEDDAVLGGATVINSFVPQLLQNTDPSAGIPLTIQDGIYQTAPNPQAVTFVGFTTELDVFDATSGYGNLFSTFNASWASLNGSSGPIAATNKVLIAQITTDGCLSFELNIQLRTPTNGTENYVAKNPSFGEISIPSLTYPSGASVNITANPSGAICAGTPVTFTATPVNGGASPQFQWKKNGVNVGTNNSTYNNSGLVNGDKITCTMTSNAACVGGVPVSSNQITEIVNALPGSNITALDSLTFCSGDSVVLKANAGAGYTYKWLKGVNLIAGALSSTYTAKAAGSYKVIVTNSNGCSKTSVGKLVTVNALPIATITSSGASTFCTGDSLVLQANTGVGFTYQWIKGTTLLPGATSLSYAAKATGNYKVTVSNSNSCSATSTGKLITVNTLPTATITAQGPTTFCAGDSVKLQANAGAGLTYQWIKGTVNINGSVAQSYTAKAAGNYKVKVTNSNGCSKTSAGKLVTVNCRVQELSNSESKGVINLFPNPSEGPFTIVYENFDLEDGVAKIELVNVIGQTLYSTNGNFINNQLQLTIDPGYDLEKGLYLVKIELNGKVVVDRLMLQ